MKANMKMKTLIMHTKIKVKVMVNFFVCLFGCCFACKQTTFSTKRCNYRDLNSDKENNEKRKRLFWHGSKSWCWTLWRRDYLPSMSCKGLSKSAFIAIDIWGRILFKAALPAVHTFVMCVLRRRKADTMDSTYNFQDLLQITMFT